MKHEFFKRFAFPLNAEEIKKDMDFYKMWFSKYNSLIKEMYFVLNDFGYKYMKDMNGEEVIYDYRDFISYVKSLNINTTLTINNIFELNKVNPEILKVIEENKDLIDSIVVPNEYWIEPLKKIKNFFIKNTVIQIPDENFIKKYHNLYDEIYIHDEIIHNHDKFLKLKKKYNIKLGTVVNFIDCVTFCTKKQKHYELVNKKLYNSNYFCPTEQFSSIEELLLKRNSIPGFYYSYQKYLDVIDTYKLQGRITEVERKYKDLLNIIENIYKKKKILIKDYIILYKILPSKKIREWQDYTLNCGGNCPQCNYCDKLLNKKGF